MFRSRRPAPYFVQWILYTTITSRVEKEFVTLPRQQCAVNKVFCVLSHSVWKAWPCMALGQPPKQNYNSVLCFTQAKWQVSKVTIDQPTKQPNCLPVCLPPSQPACKFDTQSSTWLLFRSIPVLQLLKSRLVHTRYHELLFLSTNTTKSEGTNWAQGKVKKRNKASNQNPRSPNLLSPFYFSGRTDRIVQCKTVHGGYAWIMSTSM